MPASPESVRLFNALPTPHLLLSPALVIEAVSEAFLHVTLTQRAQLVGQYLFDIFPNNPQTPEADGLHTVRTSLLQVLATGQPHEIARQHYDLPDPARPGHFIERHWQVFNSPVLDAQGQVVQLIHATVDVTKQVLAQAHLRASQAAEQRVRAEAEAERQRFQDVLLQLPAHVAVYQGPNHVYQFVNPPYQRQFPHRTFLGRPLHEAVPEATGLGLVALFDQVYQTGEPHHVTEVEGWFDFKGTGEPEQLFLNLTLHPLRDAQGRIDGILDFSYDVTEQVRSRRQVQQFNQELETRVQERTREVAEQQRLISQILAQVPAAITTLHGPDHRFTFANNRYQRLTEGRVQVGRTVAETLPEVAEQGFIELLDNVYRSGQTYEGREIAILLAPPTGPPVQHYLDFTYQPMPDEHGQTQGLLVFAVDVTEQVRTRRQATALQDQLLAAARHQAAERLAFYQLFEQTPALVALLRAPGHRFEYVNPAYQALFPGRQLVGREAAEAAPELRAQGSIALLDRVYQTGEPYFGQETPFTPVAASGEPAATGYFDFTYQAYRENGAVAGVTIFAFDVTGQVLARQQVQDLNQALAAINQELTATNEELNVSNTQLTRTNVDLDTFVYTASHDLKAPITNIEGIVLALRDTLPADVRQDAMVGHLLDLLNQTVVRFQFTIGQLTDISRLQLAHAGPAEPVVLATVVEDVRLDLAPDIAAAGTQLTVAVAPELVVSFSPANLRSIVYNLLSNAIKYRAPDRPSQVQLRAEQTPHAITLTVQDNGLGMSQVQQRQLFGLFQRLHTHVEGTGVGLYITKRLIENAGGTIAVVSEPQVGTTFTVTFPA